MYFLDTTYILPFAGIETKIVQLRDQLKQVLKKIEFPLLLSHSSLLELKWIALGEYRSNQDIRLLQRCNTAIQSIIHSSEFSVVDAWRSTEILSLADNIRIYGHKDYMDCMILASAKFRKQVLITEDQEFPKLIENIGWDLEIKNWYECYQEFI